MPIVFPFTLRAKFLVAMAFISTLLTTTTLLVVRARVQTRVREQLAQDLDGSLNTFRALQQQREQTLERSAALLASLPPLMAMMTSQDIATIQDASATYWQMSGSQLFGLADVSGHWLALHAQAGRTSREDLQSARARARWQRGELAIGGSPVGAFSKCSYNRFISAHGRRTHSWAYWFWGSKWINPSPTMLHRWPHHRFSSAMKIRYPPQP